jgi:hypothetical protein
MSSVVKSMTYIGSGDIVLLVNAMSPVSAVAVEVVLYLIIYAFTAVRPISDVGL